MWLIGVFMVVMGIAIAGIWTRDIVTGHGVNLSAGVLRAREPGSGSLFWPHWLAEYGTALALLTAGIGLILDSTWGRRVGLVALGALVYTSTNALGWALAERERRPYALPMLVGLIGGVTAIVALQ